MIKRRGSCVAGAGENRVLGKVRGAEVLNA